MQLSVLRELRQPLGSISEFDLEDPRVDLEGTELRDVRGDVRLLRTDRGLLARVRLTATLPEQCARCLKDAAVAVDIEFEEEYVPAYDPRTGARIHVGEDEEVFRIGPDFRLDLREAVRQYILISEPAKPLCTPACRGLCPRCGADLNLGDCRCQPETDARWDALAGLEPARGGGPDKEGNL